MHITRRDMMIVSGAALIAGCVASQNGHTSTASADKWNTTTPLPLPVQEIYPTRHKSRIHQLGGFVAENGQITAPTAAHYSWAPGDTKWRQETHLPVARHHPQLVSFKGHLLALAGFESLSRQAVWVMQSTGWQLTDDQSWSALPELPAPCGEAVTGVTGDGHLHLAGGRTPKGDVNGNWQDHADTDHHFILADMDSSWQRAAPCPTKRNSAAGDVIDGVLHIVGGRQVGGKNVTSHEVYDSREDRWRTAAPMPQGQGGLAAAALDGKLYAFGGEYFTSIGGGVYAESWVYDPAADAWEALPDMPTPRHGLGAVAFNGKIYVIGGATRFSGNGTSSIVETFTP